MMPQPTTASQKAPQNQPCSQRAILYLILALALVRGVIYASLVPPWQAPDEPAHFERARAALSAEDWAGTSENQPAWYDELRDELIRFDFLDYTLKARPATADAPLNSYIDLYQEVYGGLYGSRLTYAALGWPLFLAPGQPVILQLYLLRLGTVLMNLVIIFLAYLTTRTIFPNNQFLDLGVPLLILFNPQHTHILSTVNNGNLTELLVMGTLYFMVKGIMRGFSGVTILLIAAGTLAAMWTKATSYFLIVPLAGIGLFYLWGFRRYWPYLLLGCGAIVGVGYFFAPARLSLLAGEAWGRLWGGTLYWDPFVPERIFNSFWAMPGWAMVRLAPFWYQLLLVVSCLSGVGWVILFFKRAEVLFSEKYRSQRQALLVLGLAGLAAIGTQIGWHILTGTLAYSQGRTIYPVIGPIAIFLLLGWQQFFPNSWQKPALSALTVILVLFDSLVLFVYIIPFFYARA